MGKSTLALSWLLRTAQKGHGVLFISLEMEAGELAERAMSDLAWSVDHPIPYEKISRNTVKHEEFQRLMDFLGKHSSGYRSGSRKRAALGWHR